MTRELLVRPDGRQWRRERGWSLSVSRAGICFRSFCDVVPAPSEAPAPDRRLRWLFPLIAGCGALTAGVLAAPATSHRSDYSISVAVPDRPMPAAVVTRLRPDHAVRRSQRHRAQIAASGETEAAAAGAADGERPASPGADDTAERRFVAIALRTGEMQSWQSGDARYFLVAGDARVADHATCRQFSLLARPDVGEESVRHFERCRAGSE